MLVLTTMLLAVAVAASDNSEESSQLDVESTELVRSLRRQLLRNNDDYSSEDSSHSEDVHLRSGRILKKRKPKNDIDKQEINNDKHNIKYDKRILENQQMNTKLTEKNFYIGKAANVEYKDFESNISYDSEIIPKKKEVEHPISKKNLLYYMDEERFIKAQPAKTIKNKSSGSTENDDNESTVKYKMLKVKRPNRRNSEHRYIQEEGKDGVAILSIDKAPFPEFRLPRSRRQYKHDFGEEITDDEEIPPPTIDTNDPGTETGTEQLVTQYTETLEAFPQ